MYPSPLYADGYYNTHREISVVPDPGFPFKEYPTPDLYTRTYDRKYLAEPVNLIPRIARRTSWTNLVIQNEKLNSANGWTETNITPTIAFATAPTGLTVMNKLLETVTNGAHSVARAVTVTAAAHEAMAFVQGGLGRDWVQLIFTDSASTVFSCFFNIASGYVGGKSAGITSALVTPLANSQFQVVMRFTPAAGAGTATLKLSTDGSTVSYAGDTAKGAYATGIQVAAGSQVPYIPTTSATRTVSAPDRDPKDPMAYLVLEEDPKLPNSRTAIVARQFARVPLQQIRTSTMPITKPTAPNSGNGSQTFAAQLSNNVSPTNLGVGSYYSASSGGYLFPPNNTVFGPLKVGTVPAQTPASSGQFRVKYKNSTTANLNYNDANATINAAINGLADVISDGITVSVANAFNGGGQGYLQITLTAGSTASFFIVDANSFNAASNSLFTAFINSTTQYIVIGHRVTIASHGFSATGDLLGVSTLVSDSQLDPAIILKPQPVSLVSGSWAVVDANTIAFDGRYSGVQWSAGAYTLYAPYLRTYTPGPDNVTIQIVEDFYLPGVTPGITTADDIPVPDPLINDTAFLEEVLTVATGFVNYNADPMDNWKGPIYRVTQRQIDMADV